MDFAAFKSLIRDGAFDQVRDAVRAQPDLLHTHDPSDDQWDQRTAMHCAARYAHLAADPVKAAAERVSTSIAAFIGDFVDVAAAATGLFFVGGGVAEFDELLWFGVEEAFGSGPGVTRPARTPRSSRVPPSGRPCA